MTQKKNDGNKKIRQMMEGTQTPGGGGGEAGPLETTYLICRAVIHLSRSCRKEETTKFKPISGPIDAPLAHFSENTPPTHTPHPPPPAKALGDAACTGEAGGLHNQR